MLYKFVMWGGIMEQEIERLRQELNRLIEENNGLHSDEIEKLSQELDNLIYVYLYMYYSSIKQHKVA